MHSLYNNLRGFKFFLKSSTAFNIGTGSCVLGGQTTGQYNTSAWGEQRHPERECWQHGNFELAEKPKRRQQTVIYVFIRRRTFREAREAGHAARASKGTYTHQIRRQYRRCPNTDQYGGHGSQVTAAETGLAEGASATAKTTTATTTAAYCTT